MIKISQSKVNTWRKCQYAHQLQYEENLAKKATPRPLKFGKIIHQMVEADAQGNDPLKVLNKVATDNKQLFLEEREMYGDIVKDIRYIMSAYFDYWKASPLVYLPRGKQFAEHSFEVEIAPGILCKGTIDAIVRSKKMNWLAEHKSHKNFPNTDHRWRNLQSCVYIRIMEVLGWWKVEGTLWDYIRSKSPTRPLILKSGEMSERSLDSLPQVVIDVCREHRIKPPADLVYKQHENMSHWFERIYTPVKKKVVDEVFTDFLNTARQMANTPRPRRGRPKSIGRHCDWCQFEDICRAELQGSDAEFVKEHYYQQSDYDQEEEQADEDQGPSRR